MYDTGKHLRVMTIKYTTEIGCHEIPLFRGAVIAAMRDERDMPYIYHNHMDEDKFRYAYPLIQYKRIGGKAAIVFINEACDTLRGCLLRDAPKMKLGTRSITPKVEKMDTQEVELTVRDTKTTYRILSWFPLNSGNYDAYMRLDSHDDKVDFLQNILKANILSMAKGLDITMERCVEATITDMKCPRKEKMKKVEMLTFDLTFSTNVCLPDYIGLGKAVSKGHGIITKLQDYT